MLADELRVIKSITLLSVHQYGFHYFSLRTSPEFVQRPLYIIHIAQVVQLIQAIDAN